MTLFPIDRDVRAVSYCAAVRSGDLSDFGFYLARYGKTLNEEERIRILGALGCTSDVDILASCVFDSNPIATTCLTFLLC
jgi:hypothetical protein